MKLYNILLLLHGEMLNQVRLEMVSAAEIQLLRQIHVGNNEAVQDIVHVANTNRTDSAERRRLANKYSPDPFSLDGEVSEQGIALIRRVFGPEGVPLPQEVPQEDIDDPRGVYDAEDEVIEMLDPSTGTIVRQVVQEVVEAVDPFAAENDLPVAMPEPVADNPRKSPLRQRASLEA